MGRRIIGMLRSRFVAVGIAFALVSVLVFTGAGMAKTGWGPPPPPPGDSGWRAYTDMNHTSCAVEVGGQVWVGTGYAGLAVYDATAATLLTIVLNSSFRAQKSVSQTTSTMAAEPASSCTATRPCFVSLSAFL